MINVYNEINPLKISNKEKGKLFQSIMLANSYKLKNYDELKNYLEGKIVFYKIMVDDEFRDGDDDITEIDIKECKTNLETYTEILNTITKNKEFVETILAKIN